MFSFVVLEEVKTISPCLPFIDSNNSKRLSVNISRGKTEQKHFLKQFLINKERLNTRTYTNQELSILVSGVEVSEMDSVSNHTQMVLHLKETGVLEWLMAMVSSFIQTVTFTKETGTMTKLMVKELI